MTEWHFVRVNRSQNVITNDVELLGYCQVIEDVRRRDDRIVITVFVCRVIAVMREWIERILFIAYEYVSIAWKMYLK